MWHTGMKQMPGPSYLPSVVLWRGGQCLTLHGHLMPGSFGLSSRFFPPLLSQWRVSTQNAKKLSNEKVTAFNEILSLPVFSFSSISLFSLLLIPPLYSTVAHCVFLYVSSSFLLPLHFSPSHPSCLLQLPPVVPHLLLSPPFDVWVCTQVESQSFSFTSGRLFMYVWVYKREWGCRQARNAPTAIFNSHFTLLRVKRPDTALCEKGRRGREREEKGGNERSSGEKNVRDGGGNDGKDRTQSVGRERGIWHWGWENNGWWHLATYRMAKRAKRGEGVSEQRMNST